MGEQVIAWLILTALLCGAGAVVLPESIAYHDDEFSYVLVVPAGGLAFAILLTYIHLFGGTP